MGLPFVCHEASWEDAFMTSSPHPLTSVAARRAGPRVVREKVLSLLTSSCSQESGPWASPWQHRRTGSGGKGEGMKGGELAQLLDSCGTWESERAGLAPQPGEVLGEVAGAVLECKSNFYSPVLIVVSNAYGLCLLT